IGEKRVVVERRDGRFQVETSGNRNADDFVADRSNDRGQLRNSLGVAARGETDKKFAAEAQNVAAFASARKLNIGEGTEGRKSGGNSCGLAAASVAAEWKDDRQFVKHQGGIFDKHGIGESGFGGKRDDARAELAEKFFVIVMLLLCDRQVDWLARDEAKFTLSERGTDAASDGDQHDEKI